MMQGMGVFLPATVTEYDAIKRQCRIKIEGITNNSEADLLADICNPIGDKGQHTELEILKGDLVWVVLIANDIRFPLIIGSRNMDNGNSEGWRKYHHANIEINADGKIFATAPNIHLKAETVTIDAKLIVNGKSELNDDVSINGDVSLSGDLSSGGTVRDSDGKNTA